MDWDDVEMEDTPRLESHDPQAQTETGHESTNLLPHGDNLMPNDGGDGDLSAPAPAKLHIRGLDDLTPDDVKAYAAEHFGAFDRIEWIDDTSANLLFPSESAAQDALLALSAVPVDNPSELPPLECLPAKPYSSRSEAHLQVRLAVVGDRKQAGASQRSRFYLLHPEYDPEERRRRQQQDGGRSRYRERDSYRGSRRDRESDRRRYEDERGSPRFDASFYDDDTGYTSENDSSRARRRRSRDDSRERARRDNSSKELFPSRQRRGDRRDRSASPFSRDIEDSRRAAARGDRDDGRQRRSRPVTSNSDKELFPLHGTKELFPSKLAASLSGGTGLHSDLHADRLTSSGSANTGFAIKGASTANVKELFPNKFGPNNGKKELFIDRLEGRGRPRQRAEDLFH